MCFGNRRDFTLEVVFYRVDRTVRSEKLYLDPKLTLPVLADMAGTNRTYASRAVCSRFRNFKDYLNGLRVEHLLKDIQDGNCDDMGACDEDEFANSYGFSNRRSMDRVLSKETGYTYRKLMLRRKGRTVTVKGSSL